MKKSVIFLSIFITLVSCAGSNMPTDSFSFKGKSVNLNGIEKLGIQKYTNRTNKKNQGTIENDELSSIERLIGLNANGEVVPIEYEDENNVIVDMPYKLFNLEVIGDFSYLIYILDNALSNQFNLYLSESDSFGNNSFDKLLKRQEIRGYFLENSGDFNLAKFIVLHNPSGKLFDLAEVIQMDEGFPYFSISNFTQFEDGFMFFTKSNLNGHQTCLSNNYYDSLTSSLILEKSCSPIDFIPLSISDSGHFSYILNDSLFESDSTFSEITDLTSDLQENRPLLSTNNILSKYYDDYLYILFENQSYKFYQGQLLSQKELLDYTQYGIQTPTFITSIASKFFYKNNFKDIIMLNLESFEFEIYIHDQLFPNSHPRGVGIYDFIFFENNLIIVGNEIVLFDLINFSTTIIDSNLYSADSFPDASLSTLSYLDTGYLEYEKYSGLNLVSLKINLQTLEIFLESENAPSITIFQIKPLN
jgi:hypothetical protein